MEGTHTHACTHTHSLKIKENPSGRAQPPHRHTPLCFAVYLLICPLCPTSRLRCKVHRVRCHLPSSRHTVCAERGGGYCSVSSAPYMCPQSHSEGSPGWPLGVITPIQKFQQLKGHGELIPHLLREPAVTYPCDPSVPTQTLPAMQPPGLHVSTGDTVDGLVTAKGSSPMGWGKWM